jgi:hypothetical protein
MVVWEHDVGFMKYQNEHDIRDFLDEKGRDGWKIVVFDRGKYSAFYIFRREWKPTVDEEIESIHDVQVIEEAIVG